VVERGFRRKVVAVVEVSFYDYGAYGEVKADTLVSYYFEDTKTREWDWWGAGGRGKDA